jgi:rhodanese-related sulfurtransferase
VLSATEVARLQSQGGCTIIDLRASADYRRGHIPDSVWSIRPLLAQRPLSGAAVLLADDAMLARAAAVDLMEAGAKQVAMLEGGFDAWVKAGLQSVATPAHPPDGECIDYLFFVHDRHAGNRESMKAYLAWEHQLTGQMDEQERAVFARLQPAGA